MTTKNPTIAPWHPGEILKEDWLADYGLTQYALAKALRIPHSRLTDIIKGRRSIAADTALRLARFYGNSAAFWLNLQSDYDLRTADTGKIAAEVQPRAA
ncbi:MAG: HigA family addiction module antidote protein [Opitutaceae bacterium]|nr:HigA family addiction module antidote protein [Opitutaceae bacterium]